MSFIKQFKRFCFGYTPSIYGERKDGANNTQIELATIGQTPDMEKRKKEIVRQLRRLGFYNICVFDSLYDAKEYIENDKLL